MSKWLGNVEASEAMVVAVWVAVGLCALVKNRDDDCERQPPTPGRPNSNYYIVKYI
jgi:hypothetical protein